MFTIDGINKWYKIKGMRTNMEIYDHIRTHISLHDLVWWDLAIFIIWWYMKICSLVNARDFLSFYEQIFCI